MTIHGLVERQVAASPDAIAVIEDGQELTYRELDARANRVALSLTAAGVGPESLVGVALPRSAGLVVTLLAVLKAGGGYLPLDPAYPSRRLERVLSDARPLLVVTDRETATALPLTGMRLLFLDELARTGPRPGPAVAAARPQNLAYVMYTSGSTGTPKGVAITHAGVVNGISALVNVVEVRPGGLTLMGTSINFDVSVFEIFSALATGAAVEVVRDVLVVAERGGWTGSIINTVPSVLAEILGEVAGTLRVDTVVLAGERLPSGLTRQLQAALPAARVVNAYGQTESFYATAFAVPAGWEADGVVPIGMPLPNMLAYVLGPDLAPVPDGEVGELYVGGEIARGYHGAAGQTAQRFVASPFGACGGRMYRTGDLARWNGEGQLECVGRADVQLKVRGFRVEPAEIEAVLLGHPAVAQAVVTSWEAPNGRKQLAGYIVPADAGAGVDLPGLRRFASSRMPGFMVPSAFAIIERLPLTPNGKLDRAALPAPASASRAQRAWARTRADRRRPVTGPPAS
jgi:amino acid adenylation domain-containing protein